MKEAMKYAVAIAITAAAMFAYMYEPPPEGAVQEVTQEASSQHHPSALPTSTTQNADQPKRELTAAELADIDPASIDWEAMKARYQHLTGGQRCNALVSLNSYYRLFSRRDCRLQQTSCSGV